MSDRAHVVILGATGYVGGAMADALENDGVEVIGYSSKTLDCTRLEAFLMLNEEMGPDTTLVFASALTPEKGQNHQTFLANVTMAANVARFIESNPPGRCVYVGSDAVYGFDVNPVTETTPIAPLGSYGLAKYAGEKLLEWASLARGVPFLSLRLTGIYGPGDPHGAYGPNAFARSLAQTRTITLFGSGEEWRDHLYIDDVGWLGAALIRSDATGVLNLASGESRSFVQIAQMIQGIVPYDIRVVMKPRTGPITHRDFDTSRLRGTVHGDFKPTPFQDGLQATLRAFGAIP